MDENILDVEELDDEIAVIRGSIWDNCRDHCRRCKLDIPENEEKRTIRKCPKCKRMMGHIPKAGILEYLKTLDPEEREAREEGRWKHLAGLVYKDLDREKHIYDDFPIPKSWMKVEAIDPHDARPTHWAFGAVSPEEIEVYGKRVHRIYFYGQLLLKGTIEDMVRNVRGFRELHGYSEPSYVMLDKKHGEKTQIEDKSWFSELQRAGLHRIRMSQSSKGDVELGHKIVRAYLSNQYSTLISKDKPGIMFARKGCGGKDGIINYMFNYQYKDDGKGKPVEEFKDWPDTIRYIAMEFPVYRSQEDEKAQVVRIQDAMERAKKLRQRA